MLSGWFDHSSANALWSIFGALVVAGITVLGYAIKTWPLVKARITEAKLADDKITDAGWKRFQDEIARLDRRIQVLEAELADSKNRERLAEARAVAAEAENARLTAFITGRSEGRQEAAIFDSARRIVEDEEDGG